MKWKRLDDKEVKNLGGSNAKVKRGYVVRNQQWPRLVVGIYASGIGFKISCSEKECPSGWWGEVPVPTELKGEVVEMLEEVEL